MGLFLWKPLSWGFTAGRAWNAGAGDEAKELLDRDCRGMGKFEENQPILAVIQLSHPFPCSWIPPAQLSRERLKIRDFWRNGTTPSCTGTWCYLWKDPKSEIFGAKGQLPALQNSPRAGSCCCWAPSMSCPSQTPHPSPALGSLLFPSLRSSPPAFSWWMWPRSSWMFSCWIFSIILLLQFQQGEPQGWHSWQSSPHHPALPETPKIIQLEQPRASLRLQHHTHAGTCGKEMGKLWKNPSGSTAGRTSTSGHCSSCSWLGSPRGVGIWAEGTMSGSALGREDVPLTPSSFSQKSAPQPNPSWGRLLL